MCFGWVVVGGGFWVLFWNWLFGFCWMGWVGRFGVGFGLCCVGGGFWVVVGLWDVVGLLGGYVYFGGFV